MPDTARPVEVIDRLPPDAFVSTVEAAAYLATTASHVRRLHRSGAMPAATVLSGRLRFRRHQLDRETTR